MTPTEAATGPAPRCLADDLVFPEGPRWHAGALWFSDIHGHRVHRLVADAPATSPGIAPGTAPRTVLETVVELDDRPSGLGFLPDGTLLVVAELDQQVLAVDGDGATRVHADLSGIGGDFLNDMVVDGRGRAYVGVRRDLGYDERDLAAPVAGTEQVALVQPDGTVRVVADDLVSPNGMVVTPDGATLVVAETRAHRLTAFTIDADGALADRRCVATTGEHFPDGICLDAEGAIWIGSPVTHAFVRVAPGGDVLDVVDVAPLWAVAPALGGPDRRTLFLLATRTSLAELTTLGHDRTRDAASTSRGQVLATTTGVGGAGWP